MPTTSILRGEVWLVNLDPTIGSEIRKTRPAVIANDDNIGVLPLKVVVPLTEWKEQYSVAPWMVRITPSADNGLDKTSAADAFQVRSLDQKRLVRCLGRFTGPQMDGIAQALAAVLAIA